MGSKAALSNGREPEELTDLVAAFELHNNCVIILRASLELKKGLLEMVWSATAYPREETKPGAQPSALASVREWGGSYKTLMGVVSRLLYSLDFALAEAEFAKATIK